MDFDMLFFADSKGSSTKSLIIRALAVHGSLSNVKLQSIIKKNFGRKVSYQAVRQALLELIDSGAIVKRGKLYAISSDWVYDLKDTVTLLEKSVLDQKKLQSIDKATTQITIKNLYEMGFFVLFSLEHKYFDITDKEKVYLQLNHLWIPFSDYNRRQALKKILTENKGAVVVKGNTLGDKMLAPWYRKCGPVKLGVNFSSDCEYIVYSDTVVQIYMDERLKKKMNEVYKLKNIFRFNLFKQLSDMTYNEYGIQIVITRNKKIAKQIKQRIESYF